MQTQPIKVIAHRVYNEYLAPETKGSAGIDLRYAGELTSILPGGQLLLETGFHIHIEDPLYAGLVMARSSVASEGLMLVNGVGLIDSDYQGEIMVKMWNRSRDTIFIGHGRRIAQLVIVNIMGLAAKNRFEFVERFDRTTERGEGRFGSTGQ